MQTLSLVEIVAKLLTMLNMCFWHQRPVRIETLINPTLVAAWEHLISQDWDVSSPVCKSEAVPLLYKAKTACRFQLTVRCLDFSQFVQVNVVALGLNYLTCRSGIYYQMHSTQVHELENQHKLTLILSSFAFCSRVPPCLFSPFGNTQFPVFQMDWL